MSKTFMTLAVLLALGACATAPQAQRPAVQVQPAAAGPQATPQRNLTHFADGLRCMDDMMYRYGVRDVSVMVEKMQDQSRKLGAGTRDMMVSAFADMTRRSRGVRLVTFGQDNQNVVQLLSIAQRLNDFKVVPQYDIRGAITIRPQGTRGQVVFWTGVPTDPIKLFDLPPPISLSGRPIVAATAYDASNPTAAAIWLGSSNSADVFKLRFNTANNAFEYVKRAKLPGFAHPAALAVDGDGNLYASLDGALRVLDTSTNSGILLGGQFQVGGVFPGHVNTQWRKVAMHGSVTIIDNILSVKAPVVGTGPIPNQHVTFA